MRVLVFAPHPDDEVLGCGGTIAKHTASGDEVFVCIVTEAYEPDWSADYISKVEGMVQGASDILGVSEVRFLGFPTVKLDTIPQKELNYAVVKCVRDMFPELIIVPHSGDVNLDHRIVFDSVMIAARPVPGNSVRRILSCEIPSETDWATPREAFVPNVYIDITDTLGKKLEAMTEYKSELKEFPHTRSLEGISALAMKRGAEIGVEAAESFELIRETIQ